MSKLLRNQYPKLYKWYQEIIGEVYYENLGIGYFKGSSANRVGKN